MRPIFIFLSLFVCSSLNIANASYVNSNADLSVPGDDKRGYESLEYVTNAKAVEMRKGKETDLVSFIKNTPLGLPKIPEQLHNPINQAKVSLGRKLFFDRRLSFNDTFSCAMCHIPEQGFSNNEIATSVGVEGRSGRRNTPTIYNVVYSTSLFHDGREEKLEQQVWGPLLAKNEMGNASIGRVLTKLRAIPDYEGLFEDVFDGQGVSMTTIGMALAAYQRTLVSGNSDFDRWFYGNQKTALSDKAIKGFKLFTGKAGCANCHRVDKEQALFMDNQLHNTGHGYKQSMQKKSDKGRIQVAPGIFRDINMGFIEQVSAPKPADLGLYEVTQDPNDRWKYRTPSLRNVTLSAPYFHDGAFQNLKEVVEFYNQGGVTNTNLDPLIKPLGLTDEEMNELVTFMQALTGDNVNKIILDSFAAPIGDISSDDPNWVRGTNVEVR